MRLEDLFSPLSPRDFVSNFWSKNFLHIEGVPDKFEHLLPWEVLNRILEEHRLEPPRLRIEKQGVPRDELDFVNFSYSSRWIRIPRIHRDHFYTHLSGGATLVLDAIDELHLPIRDTADALTREFIVPVQVNMYLGFGNSLGFPIHWDDHDVIILQVHGKKNWQIYEPTRKSPLGRDVESPTLPESSPAWEGEIQSGDLLYIPRGWWHEAAGTGDNSLHLTFGLNNFSGIDLLDWITERMRERSAFRDDLPLFGDSDEKSKHVQALREIILSEFSLNTLDRFADSKKATQQARPAFSLPIAVQESDQQIASDTTLALVTTHILVREGDKQGDNHTFNVEADGKRWTLSSIARPVIEQLASRKKLTVDDLSVVAPEIDRDRLDSLLVSLIREGLICCK